MAERGLPDGLGLALLIAVLLVAVHLIGVAGVAAPQAAGQGLAEDEVQHKAHKDGVDDLNDHQQSQQQAAVGHSQNHVGNLAAQTGQGQHTGDDAGAGGIRIGGGQGSIDLIGIANYGLEYHGARDKGILIEALYHDLGMLVYRLQHFGTIQILASDHEPKLVFFQRIVHWENSFRVQMVRPAHAGVSFYFGI